MNFESSILAAQTVSIEQFAPIRRYLPLALYVYAGTACTITSLTIQGIEQLPGAIAASNFATPKGLVLGSMGNGAKVILTVNNPTGATLAFKACLADYALI